MAQASHPPPPATTATVTKWQLGARQASHRHSAGGRLPLHPENGRHPGAGSPARKAVQMARTDSGPQVREGRRPPACRAFSRPDPQARAAGLLLRLCAPGSPPVGTRVPAGPGPRPPWGRGGPPAPRETWLLVLVRRRRGHQSPRCDLGEREKGCRRLASTVDCSVRPSAYAHLLAETPKPPNYVQGSSGKYAGSPRPAPSTTPSPLHHRDRAPGLGLEGGTRRKEEARPAFVRIRGAKWLGDYRETKTRFKLEPSPNSAAAGRQPIFSPRSSFPSRRESWELRARTRRILRQRNSINKPRTHGRAF